MWYAYLHFLHHPPTSGERNVYIQQGLLFSVLFRTSRSWGKSGKIYYGDILAHIFIHILGVKENQTWEDGLCVCAPAACLNVLLRVTSPREIDRKIKCKLVFNLVGVAWYVICDENRGSIKHWKVRIYLLCDAQSQIKCTQNVENKIFPPMRRPKSRNMPRRWWGRQKWENKVSHSVLLDFCRLDSRMIRRRRAKIPKQFSNILFIESRDEGSISQWWDEGWLCRKHEELSKKLFT